MSPVETSDYVESLSYGHRLPKDERRDHDGATIASPTGHFGGPPQEECGNQTSRNVKAVMDEVANRDVK